MSCDTEAPSVVLSSRDDSNRNRKLDCLAHRRTLLPIGTIVVLIPTILSVLLARSMKNSVAPATVSAATQNRPRDDFVERFINYRTEIAKLSPIQSLLESESPQTRALEWLAFRDETLSLNASSLELAPRYALLVVFYACAGIAWGGGQVVAQEQNVMIPFQKRTHMANCDWTDFVECDPNKRITVLKGAGFGMIGMLPEEIALLTALTALRLPTNMLEGTIPAALFSGLSNLEVLDISNNQFDGTIPTDIGLWTSLVSLDIGFNDFKGEIPKELKALSRMERFSAQDVRISGPLFEYAARSWPNLRSLSVDSTEMSGRFSTNVNWQNTLEYVDIQNNLLSGPLPSSMLENMTSLKTLKIGSNGLTGTMLDVGRMRQMEELLLKESVSGTIPTSIGELTALRELEISSSSLSGTIPTELGHCRSLQRLFLIDTAITGTIPSSLGLLTSLRKCADTLQVRQSNDRPKMLQTSLPSEPIQDWKDLFHQNSAACLR